MDEHPHAKILRDMADRMKTGDFEAAFDVLAEDVEWHEIGRAEPVRGKQALADRYMTSEGPGFDIKGEMHDVVANDEHVIGLVNATATKDGREFQYRTAEIVHVKDGKITQRWAFSDDTEAINRFFAS